MRKKELPDVLRADERVRHPAPTPDEWVTYIDEDGVTQRIGIIYTPGVSWEEVIGPIIRDFFPQE